MAESSFAKKLEAILIHFSLSDRFRADVSFEVQKRTNLEEAKKAITELFMETFVQEAKKVVAELAIPQKEL